MSYLVRAPRRDADFAKAVRACVAALDPALVLPTVGSLREQLRRGLADRELGLVLAGLFAALGLALTMIGLYGLMASRVAERRREIAVRMALGADEAQVTGLVVGQGLRVTSAGILLGLGAFAVLSRWLESQLYATRPLEPAVLAAAALIVLGVSYGACRLPARRVAGLDAGVLLRSSG